MSDETYNGWSNRETWAIQLHLSNNEGDYRAMCERAEEIVAEVGVSEWGTATNRMADYIKDWTEEVFDSVLFPSNDYRGDLNPSTPEARMFVSDVGSWWRADFYEIAKHWIDEALESVAVR